MYVSELLWPPNNWPHVCVWLIQISPDLSSESSQWSGEKVLALGQMLVFYRQLNGEYLCHRMSAGPFCVVGKEFAHDNGNAG